LRPSRTFLEPKNVIAKCSFVVKKLSRKAAVGMFKPFLRPMSAFWAKKGHFKP
jgi:hypothetical protein